MAAGSQLHCSALPISYSRSVPGVPAVSLPSSQQLWGRRAMVVTPTLVGQHPPALCLMAVLTGGPCVGSGQRAGAVSWRCYSCVPAACLPCPGCRPSGSFREGQPIAAAAHPSLQPAGEARSWPLLAACPAPLGKGRAPPKPPCAPPWERGGRPRALVIAPRLAAGILPLSRRRQGDCQGGAGTPRQDQALKLSGGAQGKRERAQGSGPARERQPRDAAPGVKSAFISRIVYA